ncbi:cytochrome P450 [Caenibius tardaugens]|nr:cytochrome P450 [Caenibius tardaugens]AZI35501.1 cytochrome P450 [Caenibius tardaugens NBRC 16725]
MPSDTALPPETADFSRFSTYNYTPLEARALLDRDRLTNPVPYSEELGGFHIFRNFEDVKRGLTNFGLYASSPSVQRPLPKGDIRDHPQAVAINSDPPEHSKWRKLLVAGMNAGVPARIEERVRADAAELIDAIVANGGGDLAADLAHQIPQRAIFYVLGFERDAELSGVHDITQKLLGSMRDSAEYRKNFDSLAAMGLRAVAERRHTPRDDFMTVLANYDFDGRPLDAEEVGRVIATLLIGGSGTAASTITSLLWNIFAQPQVRNVLNGNADLMPVAVEETLRLWTPFFALYRNVTEDHEVHGKRIAKGDTVYMCWQAANLDPQQFEAPHQFRLDRAENRHLTFGLGRHSCIGAPTARMEMRVVAEEMLKRGSALQLAKPEDVQLCFEGSETFAIPSLPVTCG